MFLEYNWTACSYLVRFGSVPTDWRGYRSFASLKEATEVLAQSGARLFKTASRTWEIVS